MNSFTIIVLYLLKQTNLITIDLERNHNDINYFNFCLLQFQFTFPFFCDMVQRALIYGISYNRICLKIFLFSRTIYASMDCAVGLSNSYHIAHTWIPNILSITFVYVWAFGCNVYSLFKVHILVRHRQALFMFFWLTNQ